MAAPEAPPALAGLSRTQALTSVRAHLRRAAVDNGDAEARLLLLAACALDPMALVRDPDVALSSAEAARLEDFAQRRARREPASRIVGRRPFWSVELAVYPDVLDPRADTEALVRLALRLVAAQGTPPRRILDLGCGSGAILCAILSEIPQAFGLGVDLSAAACAATRGNLRACGLGGRSAVVRGSWVAALGGPLDLILSNPPYIRSDEIAGLDPEVLEHDPLAALDGGPDGLDAYRIIFRDARRILAPDGLLAVEFGAGQAPGVEALAQGQGLRRVDIERDLAGRPRAAAFRRDQAQT